jgi:hypothetical protein
LPHTDTRLKQPIRSLGIMLPRRLHVFGQYGAVDQLWKNFKKAGFRPEERGDLAASAVFSQRHYARGAMPLGCGERIFEDVSWHSGYCPCGPIRKELTSVG